MNVLLRPLTLGLAASLILGAGPAPAAPLPALVASPADGEDADLERCMEALKINLKTVAAGVERAESDDDTLKALAAMQVWVLKGKTMSPDVSKLPAAKQAEHVKAFRASMATLLRELAQVEIDILDGKRDAAAKRVKGDLMALRDKSHERFQTH